MTLVKQCVEIFLQFLFLGCISFGGPAAHIGYFRTTFVDKLQWLNNDEYANLVSISQILPGPGSSQVGFAIGLHKAGVLGGVSAFLGFTLPSFCLMYFLAVTANFSQPESWLVGLIYGLKLLAVVVVFDAIISMFNSFCKTKVTITIAIVSAISLILSNLSALQIWVILIAAGVGMYAHKGSVKASTNLVNTTTISYWPLLLFMILFVLSVLGWSVSYSNLWAPYFQSGSLVFGGGHVVLPLLQANIGDSLNNNDFVFGYAAAQGVPGPMFTIATFMGALLNPTEPFIGAIFATVAIFLPGFLLVLSLKNVWQILLTNRYFFGAARGINAAVVGLLLAAFYDPIFTSAVSNWLDIIWIIAGFLLLKICQPHIVILIGGYLALGLISNLNTG